MTTKVVGQKSRKELEVSRDTAHTETETGFHTLVVEDNGERGIVSLQHSLFGVRLPIPLFMFRKRVTVDAEHQHETIWTGDEDRDIIFEAPP